MYIVAFRVFVAVNEIFGARKNCFGQPLIQKTLTNIGDEVKQREGGRTTLPRFRTRSFPIGIERRKRKAELTSSDPPTFIERYFRIFASAPCLER